MQITRALTATVASAVLVLGLAACGDDDTVSDDERQQATEAAQEATGGSSITEVEKGDDEDGYAYSVEVQGPDGQDIEVQMDEDFQVTNDPPRVDGNS